MAFRSLCTVKNTKQIGDILARYMSTSDFRSSKIGFIGVGNMGHHMVNNLMKKVGIYYSKINFHYLFEKFKLIRIQSHQDNNSYTLLINKIINLYCVQIANINTL